MLNSPSMPASPPAAGPTGAAFLEKVLPAVRAIAGVRLRHVPCPDARADAVSEAVAISWSWYLRLKARGKDPAAFPVSFAVLAVKAVAAGRRLTGQDRANDILSPACRWRRGYRLISLPAGTPEPGTELSDALAENTRSSVPTQVQFRIDFFDWLRQLPARRRRIADRLLAGHRTQDVAREAGVTAARVSQVRAELRRDYVRFLAGPASSPAEAAVNGRPA
jgi:hypothetical protein